MYSGTGPGRGISTSPIVGGFAPRLRQRSELPHVLRRKVGGLDLVGHSCANCRTEERLLSGPSLRVKPALLRPMIRIARRSLAFVTHPWKRVERALRLLFRPTIELYAQTG